MLRIRLVEEVIAERYAEQEMRCPTHLCIGQEAIAAGVSNVLRAEDFVVGGHRSHGHYLAQDADLKSMLAELYGKAAGCCAGNGGSMHLVDLEHGFLGAVPIVGSTIPIGVGAAFAAKLRGEKRVIIVYFGEGATEEGVFHEAMNFAMLKNVPCVFVCENNLYSVYSPLSVRQPEGRTPTMLARGHGMEAEQGDGNDVLEVRRLASRAVDKARRGDGPTFLELSTYRWREHCGPNYDNELGYRTVDEFERWKAQDPVNRFEKKLVTDQVVTADELNLVRSEMMRDIEDAFAFAKDAPFPEPSDLKKYLFAPTRQ